MPPPKTPAPLLANVLLTTVRVPWPSSSPKPPPRPVAKLFATVLSMMVTPVRVTPVGVMKVALPALPMPPPNWAAAMDTLLSMIELVTVSVALCVGRKAVAAAPCRRRRR